MAVGGPGVIGVSDRQINNPIIMVVFGPYRAGYLFTSKQIVLYSREDTSPITTVQGLVNNAIDFDINPFTLNYFVIDVP